jgi:glycosyltransferase involved in cell wall biosynthesis
VCIFSSIGITTAGFPRRLRRAGVSKSLAFILWDFFPIHHIEVGRVRVRWLHRPLKVLERAALSTADVIAVMSPRNESFLAHYHSGLFASTIVVPPWSRWTAQTETPKLNQFTVVFGGQMVPGRGVETLLGAARLLQARAQPIEVQIIGEGPTRQRMEALAGHWALRNVRFLPSCPREEYRGVLMRAHAGVAVTVPNVSIPSFPSKIADYCAAGLPVIVCIEDASDAGDIVAAANAGIKVAAGDEGALAQAIETMLQEHEQGTLAERGNAARALFVRELSAERAAQRLLSACGLLAAGGPN